MGTGFIVKNNAESKVADNPLAPAVTTLNVAAGEGANFPTTFPFLITLWDEISHPDPTDDSGMEIVQCTGRTTDALTIVRAQEGTADVAHVLNERVAMLITAGLFNDETYGILPRLDAAVDGKADATTYTADHTILTSQFGKTLRMNSATAKTFTFPSVAAGDDGARITLTKIGAGKVTFQAADFDKFMDSSDGGTMYNDTTETYARVDLEYCHETATWNITASGTWITV